MVMAPWNDPIPLTRGWCLFELYCTAITNSRFDVAMSQRHRDLFFEDMKASVEENINNMLATINARKSECFKEEGKGLETKLAQLLIPLILYLCTRFRKLGLLQSFNGVNLVAVQIFADSLHF